MEWLANEFGWMQWNWAGALFFGVLFGSIAGLTIWDMVSPGTRRKGFLPVATTRGDRFFLGVMGTIGILLLWLALVGNQALWVPLVIAALVNGALATRG